MSKYWVVEGCEFEFPVGSNGNVDIETDPENDVFAGPKDDPKKVYAGSMSIKISNYESLIVTNKDGYGESFINGSSVNKANGKNIILEGDSVTVTINGTAYYSSSDPKHKVTESVTVKISNAGQSEVKSN
ncbi:MAG: hypothetical protein MJZ37_01180 [Bacilli bacterium]|nr:hypothetical protein [Bacilli bacterium]